MNRKHDEQCCKRILITISFSFLHNYFDILTKLFLNLYLSKFLDTLAKLFFPCKQILYVELIHNYCNYKTVSLSI